MKNSRYNVCTSTKERQMMKRVGIGIIGLGIVGGGTIETLRAYAQRSYQPLDVTCELRAVCARTSMSAQRLSVEELYHADWREVVTHPEVDIVVELIGGTTEAFDVVTAALEAGKDVVTANKALIATRGLELFECAQQHQRSLRFEAAVAGGIPIIHALEHSLVAHPITHIAGILNGTTNYMLSRMTHEGLAYDEVLQQAQELGYAEADPSADVDGHDSAAKIAILASLATGHFYHIDHVSCHGIRQVSSVDIALAHRLGAVIKLIAQASIHYHGEDQRPYVSLDVQPYMIAQSHALAHIDGATNAVMVTSEGLGETVYIGSGAGALPTASAVTADIFALASARAHGQQPGEALMRAQRCLMPGYLEPSQDTQMRFVCAVPAGMSSNHEQVMEALTSHDNIECVLRYDADEHLKQPYFVMQTTALCMDERVEVMQQISVLVQDGEIVVYPLMPDDTLLKG